MMFPSMSSSEYVNLTEEQFKELFFSFLKWRKFPKNLNRGLNAQFPSFEGGNEASIFGDLHGDQLIYGGLKEGRLFCINIASGNFDHAFNIFENSSVGTISIELRKVDLIKIWAPRKFFSCMPNSAIALIRKLGKRLTRKAILFSGFFRSRYLSNELTDFDRTGGDRGGF
ncbi:GSCOCG00012573001-RA-CDS [Cotesia congregata]|nr:GSCOCG00012573001-RA-CDS [Cotesia congregata]